MSTSSPLVDRRITLALLVFLAIGSGAGLTSGLVSYSPLPAPADGRPLTPTEAERLAAMRMVNHRDARAGVRATLGPRGAERYLAGWVDWRQNLIYLAVTAPGAERTLLQARPGVVATRPHRAEPATGGLPPAVPPSGNWRLRPASATGSLSAVDALLSLLFAVADQRVTAVEALARGNVRWLGRDHAGETPVDILLGPDLPRYDTAQTRPPTGGTVRYWLGADARLHRVEALLTGGQPARIDLDRTDRPTLTAIDQLGGPQVTPRAVTAAEADLLARMPRRLRDRGGARVSLTVPTSPPGNLRGGGWVNWRDQISYLIVRDLDQARPVTLLRATRRGVAARPAPRWAAGETPPLPPPSARAWTYTDWDRRGDAAGGLDLDLLLHEALALPARAPDRASIRRPSARWLRADTVDGTTVHVFEIPAAAEAAVAPGQARLRYWVDDTGLLHRLELRTRIGGYAHLDLEPAPVPYVPAVPI